MMVVVCNDVVAVMILLVGIIMVVVGNESVGGG